jgi:NADPH-dependent curcumin reductase CurA
VKVSSGVKKAHACHYCTSLWVQQTYNSFIRNSISKLTFLFGKRRKDNSLGCRRSSSRKLDSQVPFLRTSSRKRCTCSVQRQTLGNTSDESYTNEKRIAMGTFNNKKWILKRNPRGKLIAERDLELKEEALRWDEINLGPDEVAVLTEMFSVDAFIRTMLDDNSILPGDPIVGTGFGTVIKAGKNQAYKVGTSVFGIMEVATIAIVPKSRRVQPMTHIPGIKPSLNLGLMGTSGFTAFFGLFCSPARAPKPGETVVVSAAAGAVGSLAAQMAKIEGARVIGIAGGPLKTQFLLDELKLDGAIDYKDDSQSLAEQLAEKCPDGIDFYFDNVGGATLDAVLDLINTRSRIVICGALSQYDTGRMFQPEGIDGPSNYIKLSERNSSMSGFTLAHCMTFSNTIRAFLHLLWHYKLGNLIAPEHIETGIQSFGKGLEMLFSGGHVGRLLIQISPQK